MTGRSCSGEKSISGGAAGDRQRPLGWARMDLAEHLAEYKENGFTVFPALHSAEWVAEVSCDARAQRPVLL